MTDLFDLSGRVAIVTGASSGIGKTLAGALACHGASVILAARRKPQLDKAVQEIEACGGRAASVVVDLANYHDAETHAAQLSEPYGSADILVNAAGVNLREPVDEVTTEHWERTLAINVSTPFFLARALVPGMRAKGWGRIINIASLQSERAFPDCIAYGTSKGGVAQLTRAMAEAWSSDGINANAIAPGFFPTELTAAVFADKERSAKNAAQTAVGRNGVLEDLSGTAVYLASRASDYVTGQLIFVDGGFTAK